jgi:hypothetical protein
MYNGPWLQVPLGQLESAINMCLTGPEPRPYDQALLNAIHRIRRNVDEATDLAVRAASGFASSPGIRQGIAAGRGQMNTAEALGFTSGKPGPQVKLSRERQFRMREMAIQKLAEAYRLDEVATSNAAMHSSSLLDDLAKHVLQRDPHNLDALYVNFFHDKVPTRQVAEFTTFEALDEIIRDRKYAAAALRTRAVSKMFKKEYESAILDLTAGLHEARFLTHDHLAPSVGSNSKSDLERGVEGQLLFHRANIHLKLATRQLHEALDYWEVVQTGSSTYLEAYGDAPRITKREAEIKHLEMRQFIKSHARRALRDYMSFLAMFSYCPRMLPKENSECATAKLTVFKVSDLFSPSAPLQVMPRYPPMSQTDIEPKKSKVDSTDPFESINFHPLLPEALCSLLLCHAILQTPPTELRRHSHVAAKLICLLQGAPLFSEGRAGSGADWNEVVSSAGDWLQLPYSWAEICRPRRMTSVEDDDPGPRYWIAQGKKPFGTHERGVKALLKAMEGAEERRSVHERALDRAARQVLGREGSKQRLIEGGEVSGDASALVNGTASKDGTAAKDAEIDYTNEEMPFATARSESIARWTMQAPLLVEGEATKKKGKKRAKKAVQGMGQKGQAVAGAQVLPEMDGLVLHENGERSEEMA